jgi:hypothetical protein
MWDEDLKFLHVLKSFKKCRMKIKVTAMLVTLVEHHQQ